jgi:hypothetical protein
MSSITPNKTTTDLDLMTSSMQSPAASPRVTTAATNSINEAVSEAAKSTLSGSSDSISADTPNSSSSSSAGSSKKSSSCKSAHSEAAEGSTAKKTAKVVKESLDPATANKVVVKEQNDALDAPRGSSYSCTLPNAAAAPETTEPVIPVPPSLPKTTAKTEEVAKKRLNCWDQKVQSVKNFFHRSIKWLKSVPGKIADVFKRCLGLKKDADPLNESLKVKEENVVRTVKAQKKPVRYYNKDNNCWFNASSAMLNALGDDFFNLIDAKAIQLDAAQKKYNKDDARYKRKKARYDEKVAEYKIKNEAYLVYRGKMEAYEQNTSAIMEEYEAQYKEALENYLQAQMERADWRSKGRNGPRPPLPINPKSMPLPKLPKIPDAVAKPKPINELTAPKKPIGPVNDVKLIKALLNYKKAVKDGDEATIRLAAKQIYNLLPEYSGYFGHPGKQEDASEFFSLILWPFLAPSPLTTEGKKAEGTGFFIIKKQNIGIEGTEAEGFEGSIKYEAQSMLQVAFPRGGKTANFQDMLDNAFAEEKFAPANPNDGIDLVKDGIEVRHTQVNIHTALEGDLPEFLFVQAKRYDTPSLEQLKKERRAYKAQQIKKIVADAMAKAKKNSAISIDEGTIQEILDAMPDQYKGGQVNLKDMTAAIVKATRVNSNFLNDVANDLFSTEEKLRLKNILKEFVPNKEAKKNEKQIKFPENGIVTIAGVEYIPTAVVIQHGVMGGGHYVAAVRGTDPVEGHTQWYHANDIGAGITPIEGKDIDQALGDGYIYMLRKVKKEVIAEPVVEEAADQEA